MKNSRQLHMNINSRGWEEQQRAIMLSGLYENAAKKLNRLHKGIDKQFTNEYKSGKLDYKHL